MFCGERKYVIKWKKMGPHYICDPIFYSLLPPLILIRTLQWLPISLKTKAKALKLACMSLQDLAPCHLSNLIPNYSLA